MYGPLSALTVLLSLTQGFCADSGPLGPVGTVATYRLEADPAQRPEYERDNRLTVVGAELQVGPTEADGARQWLGLRWDRLNGQSYQLWLLVDRWPNAGEAPRVFRYLWREPDWPDAVEFVHEVTGEALLPRIPFWRYGWPQEIGVGPEGGRPVAGQPEKLQLQGWEFTRMGVTTAQVGPPGQVTVVALNPDLIIGHMTRNTDVAGKPYWALPDGKYEYRATTPEDHRKHFEAGFTLFQARPRTDWLTRSSAWDNTLFWYLDDWPAQLYRSNYWGRQVYLDEPAIHNRVLNERVDLAGKLTPAEAVAELQRIVSGPLWVASGNYSRVMINSYIDAQFGRGNLRLTETQNPVWEALWPTAWYQLAVENGLGGIVDEDAAVGDLVEGYNRAFGTQIPATVQNACAIRVAVLRGAARNFSKRWGVAFYSPAEPRLKASSIPYLYDKGAGYFWVWTGWVGIGDNSGLPYSYQRYYASLVRQAQARNPRRDMDALLRAAKTCIVIPYGFTFAPYPLQYLRWLHLERQTPEGATYRRVLTNAALEVERCLRQGAEFDIAVDDPKLITDGYDEVIYCREDGSVLVRTGGGEETLPGGREPPRPDLGPPPSISIEVPQTLPSAPGKLTLRALPVAGTGEFENGKPSASWEVYGPDQGVELRTGEQLELDLPVGGRYRVRAAVADVFGRPAVAWAELDIEDTSTEAASLPSEWAFRTDPEKVGETEGWFRPELDDSSWQRVPVPSWWETTPVGAYDGMAWYRVRFDLPAELTGRDLRLEFGAVDEEAWVYVNGRYVGEQSVESTGQTVDDIWDKPFSIPIPADALRYGESNLLAVRVNDTSRYGGIFRPVRLVVGS